MNEVDSVDRDFLLLIIRGYTSSYTIWSHVKKETKEKGAGNTNLKVMAYNNVNKRIVNLTKDGLIEEVKIGDSIHGRKDYKVNLKGLSSLMPHIIAHPEDAKVITEYMDRFQLDKRAFGDLLVSKVVSIINSVNQYLGSIRHLDFASMLNIDQLNQMLEPVSGYYKELEHMYDVLFIEQTKHVTYRKSKTGHTHKFTSRLVPEQHEPFFEQEQRKLEQGLKSPEIADRELEEDLYRLTKPSGQAKRPLPPSSTTTHKKKR